MGMTQGLRDCACPIHAYGFRQFRLFGQGRVPLRQTAEFVHSRLHLPSVLPDSQRPEACHCTKAAFQTTPQTSALFLFAAIASRRDPDKPLCAQAAGRHKLNPLRPKLWSYPELGIRLDGGLRLVVLRLTGAPIVTAIIECFTSQFMIFAGHPCTPCCRSDPAPPVFELPLSKFPSRSLELQPALSKLLLQGTEQGELLLEIGCAAESSAAAVKYVGHSWQSAK